jgi:hypothetical protein
VTSQKVPAPPLYTGAANALMGSMAGLGLTGIVAALLG